jgi:hypothetical protein
MEYDPGPGFSGRIYYFALLDVPMVILGVVLKFIDDIL